MVNFFEFDVENPFAVRKNNMSGFLSIVDILSCEVFSDFNNGKVSEIGSALDDHRVIDFLLYNQVIMSTQN
jgi:hypothetical protein